MNQPSRSTKCSSCKAFLPSRDLQTCPNCGSTNKQHQIALSGNIQPRRRLKAIGYDPTLPSKTKQKKNRIEVKAGDDWSYDRKKWVHKERVIDKRNDHYRECITDPDTGKVIRNVDEPLRAC